MIGMKGVILYVLAIIAIFIAAALVPVRNTKDDAPLLLPPSPIDPMKVIPLLPYLIPNAPQ